jgi:carbamoyl-phosphate synthase large subunit
VTTILVSAAGAPGTAALVRALRENGEREVRVVGTDMAERSVGRFLCDAFHLVPSGSDSGFADAMIDVVEREGVDAILPQSSFDLLGLADAKDRFERAAVMVASPEAVRRSNDKAESYALLDEIGVPGPRWRRVVGGEAVAAAARELGYPSVDVAIKPAFSSGSRGFRILSAEADRREQLLTNRPGVAEALRLEELVELLGDDETPLLVMELASGLERTIDGIAEGGRIALGHPKTRESMRAGLAMYFATLDDEWLMEIAE